MHPQTMPREEGRDAAMTSAPANGNNAGPPQQQVPGGLPPQHVVRRTRIGGMWIASALFALVLLLLLIFILENGQRVNIGYFGAHGHLPLGVALLLAAVLGVLLVVIPGTGRIVQLRITARRHRGIDARQPPGTPAASATQAASGQQAAPGEPGQD
jgi:lipopolysaccharide assembly protein A